MAEVRIPLPGHTFVLSKLKDEDVEALLTAIDKSFRERGGIWLPTTPDAPRASMCWVPAAKAQILVNFDEQALPPAVEELAVFTAVSSTLEKRGAGDDPAPALGIFDAPD